MERKDILKENKFLLTGEQKIALMEAKVARAEAHIKALAEIAKLQESARGSKYSSR